MLVRGDLRRDLPTRTSVSYISIDIHLPSMYVN